MLRFFYTLIFILALPVIFYRLWVKDKKVPGYRIRWPERFGISSIPLEGAPIVWVHAVSVGEVIAAVPLIKRLLQCANIRVLVTTMTPTGSTRVKQIFGDSVLHVYAPYDLPWTVNAFLRRTHPILVIIMETELWPNMLTECARQKLPMILANARMSEKSVKGYLRFPKTTKQLLNCLHFVGAQNPSDGDRFLRMGIEQEKLTITGNIKFDVHISQEQQKASQALRIQYGQERPIIVAASTHEGEDQIILDAFAKILQQHPNTLLILVPRHPERFDDVAQLSENAFRCIRRSSNIAPSSDIQVVVGDTMGELMLLYGIADIAFVGGSLIDRGGHNMIEPACWGLPILCGPHTFNFADVSRQLLACNGMVTIHNPAEFSQQATSWISNKEERKTVGDNAKNFASHNRGAVDRLISIIQRYIDCP